MEAASPKIIRPPSYPIGGTYADLLYWHLYIWGTRPRESLTVRPEKQWRLRDFKKVIFDGSVSADTEKKNSESWLGRGRQYPPGDDYAPKIVQELFGNEEKFAGWADDLEEARERCKGPGNNPINLKREAALAELTRAGLIGRSVPLAQETFPSTETRRHFATAPRENVALVVDRLTDFFVGREDEIEAIDRFVSDRMAGGSRGLLVITAPAGFGKSAFAAHWCTKAGQAPNRRIAYHFSSVTTGTYTTALGNIGDNLLRQVAECMSEPIDLSGSFNALAGLLEKSPPDGIELVIWLDGIDEAQDRIECFLPLTLGDRVCVIISARAEDDGIPGYLAPWLADEMAVSHRPVRRSLTKLPLTDVGALVGGLFAADGLSAPEGLARSIFNASTQGYPLFARNMTVSAIEAVKEGKSVDLGEAPESLRDYADSELRRLESLVQWPELQALFAFMTIAKDAVQVDELPLLIGKRISPRALPHQLMRWFSLFEAPRREQPALLSFAHPLLRDVFGQALGHERKQAIDDLCDRFTPPFCRWPIYALQHLPRHLLDANRVNIATELLADVNFIAARFAALGSESSPKLMAADWMAWFSVRKQKGVK